MGVVFLQQVIQTRSHLHEYVSYFETLNYDKEALFHSHHRIRKSNQGEKHLKLSFRAFETSFNLQLKPDDKYLHKDFELVVDGRPYPKSVANSYFYAGHDVNDQSVYAHGNLAFGVFDGTIHTKNEVYYIEPSERYYKNGKISDHSVIYRHSDSIKHGNTSKPFCAEKANLGKLSSSNKHGERNNHGHVLHTRQDGNNRDKNKVRCWLNIVGDYFFYSALTSERSDERLRVAQATAALRNFVAAASTNFERTDFDGDGNPDEITFGIRKISINTTNNVNPFSNEFLGVESLLEAFSREDWDEYCLSYLFTYRDFEDGVLGLAFVAKSDGSGSGGVCEKEARIHGTYKTYNTGVVSLLNYGRRVTNLVSQLTFTHEVGHSFGSEHDTDDCGGGKSNKYVMFAKAVDGSRSNNNKFSKCSIDYIFPVLRDKAQNEDDNIGCLRYADDNCGNLLIDDGEYCDCGIDFDATTGICYDDHCCNGSSCMLAENVQCSPQQGICCNASCRFVPASELLICSSESECAYNQTCNGTTAFCPSAEPKLPEEGENARSCNEGSNYCVDGECTGSICVPLQLQYCECEEDGYQCHICCRLGNGKCVSTILLAKENETARELLPNGMGNVQPVGIPCNSFDGYCDFFNVCRAVNSDGALKRITEFIQGAGVIQTTVFYTTKYWWAGLIGAVVILLMLFLIVLGCHFFLPRPEHMKERSNRRKRARRNRPMRRDRIATPMY